MGKVWASNVSRKVPRIFQKYFMCILLLIILLDVALIGGSFLPTKMCKQLSKIYFGCNNEINKAK